jgi:hypothetical protein
MGAVALGGISVLLLGYQSFFKNSKKEKPLESTYF